MTLTYHSTRGQAPTLTFDEAVLAGLASDGGLYIPDSMPQFTAQQLEQLAQCDYVTLATEILWLFVGGEKRALHQLLADSYATFRHEAIAPLKQLGGDDWLLELFHGPTLAFKDFALQFLGRLLDGLLEQRGEQVTVLGATSGDTGSAAIAGCRGRDNMRIVILHPHERVSPIQRRQMTTIHDANVHNIAIEGSFDDCQNIVKQLFTEADFRKNQRLTAVNSINWARIIAQIIYYFYAAFRLGASAQRPIHFCVPTGNFGDIYAGYLAKRMGLPVGELIIASNRNDILTRCVETGEYRSDAVVPSLSPSMDIQISSNFERLLFEFYERDAVALGNLMKDLKATGSFTLSPTVHGMLREHFGAVRADDAQTEATIRSVYEATGEVIDPHTAVGIFAAQAKRAELQGPIVTLATAHPAKFPAAVKAAIGIDPVLPSHMADIWDKDERFSVLPNDAAAVRAYVEKL